MACPLCQQEQARPSWIGAACYRGKEYPYLECYSCGSLYCDPMPDLEALSVMYGADYATSSAADPGIQDPKQPERVVALLAGGPPGVFLDYGCGQGGLLKEAQRLSWTAVGVEFDADVARRVERETGARVLVAAEAHLGGLAADVLHLGDVIEHLTDLDHQFPEIMRVLKPGGLLVAQGPLENNASLFISVLRLARSTRGTRRTEMAPYHVLLATAEGQRGFFRRFGLEEVEFSLDEVSWPAPERLFLGDLKRPRSVALFCLRRLSQMVSALGPDRLGNRYFYIGRKRSAADGTNATDRRRR